MWSPFSRRGHEKLSDGDRDEGTESPRRRGECLYRTTSQRLYFDSGSSVGGIGCGACHGSFVLFFFNDFSPWESRWWPMRVWLSSIRSLQVSVDDGIIYGSWSWSWWCSHHGRMGTRFQHQCQRNVSVLSSCSQSHDRAKPWRSNHWWEQGHVDMLTNNPLYVQVPRPWLARKVRKKKDALWFSKYQVFFQMQLCAVPMDLPKPLSGLWRNQQVSFSQPSGERSYFIERCVHRPACEFGKSNITVNA